MESILVSPSGAKKIIKNTFELYKQDIEQSIKGVTPGLWCYFEIPRNSKKYIGYINPHVEDNRPCAYIVEEASTEIDPWGFIKGKIELAIQKREILYKYGSDSRLVYGHADGLPGLIVDCYQNSLYVQINTAGIDRFRKQLGEYFQTKFEERIIIFLDNEKYRKGEMLPIHEKSENEPEVIKIRENKLSFEVTKQNKQKIGYYYDHRENRARAARLVQSLEKNDMKALDLFCYIGSWGINLLNAHVSFVDFVDQGNFSREIERNLELNEFTSRGAYHRANVFEYLKENKNKRYDVICSDPPAFCKSKKEKRRAIDGYLKLHKLCLDLMNPQSIFIACSCTHYVDHAEFQQTVIQAARLANKKVQLLDIGMQGFDHPIESTEDKESYLKYYAYYVE